MTASPPSTPSRETVTVRTVFSDRAGALSQADAMQRQGFTLSEIAEEMDCRRDAIVHMLYWQRVRS